MRARYLTLLGLAIFLSGCFGSSDSNPPIDQPTRPPDESRIDIATPVPQMSNADLIQSLGHVDHQTQVRAETALLEQGSAVVPQLINALNEPNWHVRAGAIRMLGRLGRQASDALPRLRSIAENDESEAVRDTASFNISAIEGGEENLWQVK